MPYYWSIWISKKIFLKVSYYLQKWTVTIKYSKDTENHSERLIGHLESQILFLQRELKEKDELVNSLLDQISKCNDIIITNQELSKIT